jgi:hypothetical protein
MANVELTDDEIEFIVSMAIGDVGYLETELAFERKNGVTDDTKRINKSLKMARSVIEKLIKYRRGGVVVAETNNQTDKDKDSK